MDSVFLIGGGWQVESFPQTYGRFLRAAIKNGRRRVALVIAEEEETDPQAAFTRFFSAFESVGLKLDEAAALTVSAQKSLTVERLAEAEPTGVFVAGGLTPAYYEGLCVDPSWLEFLRANQIPYAGFSAGAAIAAENAIIGGWKREVDSRSVDVANENAAEDLELLDVRPGLGLVPFAVEVHATQWGNLTRLIHAVDAGLAESGWAIDENTMLEIIDGRAAVYGAGNAYLVRKADGKIRVEITNRE
jgi:cyanophycinase